MTYDACQHSVSSKLIKLCVFVNYRIPQCDNGMEFFSTVFNFNCHKHLHGFISIYKKHPLVGVVVI